MKKNLFRVGTIAAATTAFFMVSCSNDDIMSNGASGDEVQLSFNLGLENAAVTRAIGDGQTVNTLSYAVYSNGTLTKIAPVDHKKVSYPAQVTITLAKGQEYDIVFWADADTCYNFSAGTNEANITVDYSKAKNNNEGADAFFAKKTVNVSSNQNIDVTLKRPFAQINVGTNDKAAAEAAGVVIAESSATIKGLANTLNLLSGKASVVGELSTELTFALNAIPGSDEKLVVKDDNNNNVAYDYMSMTYVLLPDSTERQVIDAVFNFTSESSNAIELKVPSVPAQRNYRTNILGSILTSQVVANIKIDANFDNDYYVDAELANVAENGGVVTLQKDVTLYSLLEFKQDAVINLNGKTISMVCDTIDVACPIKVVGGATVTINGDGNVNAGSGAKRANIAVWAANGKVIINGGTYTNGNTSQNTYSDLIYTTGGSIEINGGYFETYCTPWYGKYYVLNQHNSLGGPITVTGGTFVNYNPANGDDNLGGNFVAPTSTVAQEGNKYVVTQTTVSSAEEFVTAINEGRNFVMTEDIVLNAALTANNDIVIDGQGHTISGKTLTFTGNVSIKNVVFENAQNGSESAIYVYAPAENVTIEGCTFNEIAYEALQITSKDLKSVTIDKCYFVNEVKGHGARYIHIEPNTKLNEEVGAFHVLTNAPISVTNCTFKNVTKDYASRAFITTLGTKIEDIKLENNIITGEVPEDFAEAITIYNGIRKDSEGVYHDVLLNGNDFINNGFTIKN
jgi:uncharacterized protein YaiI (UPF0178 family)